MNKFKAGDEVRRVIDADSFVRLHGKDTAIVERVEGVAIIIGGNWWTAENFELVEEWTVYNNTKPMSELGDEQAGQLFNHKRNGGDIVSKSVNGWVDSYTWHNSWVYRAKQKSERELFIEAADYYIDCGDEPAVIAGKMFDAGFKAPKGGE